MNEENEDSARTRELKAESEVLKEKLEKEFGMMRSDTSALSPEMENQWLSNIYDYERRFQEGKKIKIYEAIGSPPFKKHDELAPEEIKDALEQILSIMEEKGIALDVCCDYEEIVIYRFITEELFDYEMDDVIVEGMVQHFIYEEFHPNHDYDLRRYYNEFIDGLLNKVWNPDFDTHSLSKSVSFGGKEYSDAEISSLIAAFQDDRTFQIDKQSVDNVKFDIGIGEGQVQGYLAYNAFAGSSKEFHEGDASINFIFENGYWYICGISLPGFGNPTV